MGGDSGISLPCYLPFKKTCDVQDFFLDRIDRSSFSLLEECSKGVLTALPNCLVCLLFLVTRYLAGCLFPTLVLQWRNAILPHWLGYSMWCFCFGRLVPLLLSSSSLQALNYNGQLRGFHVLLEQSVFLSHLVFWDLCYAGQPRPFGCFFFF